MNEQKFESTSIVDSMELNHELTHDLKMAEMQNSTNVSTSDYINNSIIYVTDNTINETPTENPLNTGDNTVNLSQKEHDFYAKYALFSSNDNIIKIPRNCKRAIERTIPNKYLTAIDTDRSVAIEKCFLFLSNLTSTICKEVKWKSLSSKILHQQTKKGKDNTYVYPHIIKALQYTNGKTQPIIEVEKNKDGIEIYQQNVKSKSYSFYSNYNLNDLVDYTITSKVVAEKKREFLSERFSNAKKNIIASNLIELYPRIQLPTIAEIEIEAKRLIKLRYTKKGKTLTRLNKHSKTYYKDAHKRSFVEDNIKTYKYLTEPTINIPIIGNEKSGGRVSDSFTSMPSWIRKLLKIDGENIVELDFKALHPNITMYLYGGTKKYLTHQMVAEEAKIDVSEVKIHHLSFFNKRVVGMKNSPLYNYYEQTQSEILKNIIDEKNKSPYGHKITSRKLFAKEVEIMTECIRRLNEMEIFVGYIYDALFCKESEQEIVKRIMNEVVVEVGVYTTAE